MSERAGLLTSCAVLALCGAALTARAQDTPPPAAAPPLRVEVEVESQIDGQPEEGNPFQYFVWERLNHFGARVDSKKPTRFDRYIRAADSRWQERFPDAPPASLFVRGVTRGDYTASEFYGQTQAHTYNGTVDVTVTDGSGAQLAAISFPLSLGRAASTGTKSKTLQEFGQLAFTSVVVVLLHHPAIHGGLPEDKRAGAAKWAQEQRTKLITFLEGENLGQSELAELLRGLTPPAGAPAGARR